jgi:hypothetical protein
MSKPTDPLSKSKTGSTCAALVEARMVAPALHPLVAGPAESNVDAHDSDITGVTKPARSNTTPVTSGVTTPTADAVFRIPRKIVVSSSSAGHPSLTSLESGESQRTNLKLNNSVINNLNNSLKAKQKFINTKEPYPRSPAVIADILNRSPQTIDFPNNVSDIREEDADIGGGGGTDALRTHTDAEKLSLRAQSEKVPPKRLQNQTSTRTDFFAAKLASAVDDVDSSDSDETFVYENTAPNYKNMSNLPTNTNNSPKLEARSTNASVLNSPGILSSPPAVQQHHDETQNTTLNSVHADTLGLNESVDATSADKKRGIEGLSGKPNTRTSASNDSGMRLAEKEKTKSSVTDNAKPSHFTKVTDSGVEGHEETSPHHIQSKPTVGVNTSMHISQSSTSSNSASQNHEINATHSNTSTPIGVGKTDSIQSLRSIKFPKVGAGANLKSHAGGNHDSGNTVTLSKDVTTISGKERPQTQRSSSIYSVSHASLMGNDEKMQFVSQLQEANHSHVQLSPNGSENLFTNGPDQQQQQHSSLRLFDSRSSYQPSKAGTSILEPNDDRYSSDDMDEDAEVIDDVASTDGEFYSNDAADTTLHVNLERDPKTRAKSSEIPATLADSEDNYPYSERNHHDTATVNNASTSNFGANPTATNSVTSRGTKKKSSTSSSKLRSTTSKLFDKKGSQPRRYSIIPNDIDIEDFDDELIYYDNNIRFPYNNLGDGGNASTHYTEASPLIGDGKGNKLNNAGVVGGVPGRLSHYRSLNLKSGNPKNSLKSKRFSSGGPTFTGPINESNQNSNLNKDIFPFPYPDTNQPYYYDFDEYDEVGSQSDGGNKMNPFVRKASRNLSGHTSGPGYPQLSEANSHFFFPRKRSTSFEDRRFNCVKSFIYTLISILTIMSIGFVMGFLLATTKELTHVSILSIENTLVSQDELVFNIVVEAFNPGWFSVEILEVELDVFAKSGYIPDPDEGNDGGGEAISTENADEEKDLETAAIETVLLGSVYALESPMYFRGGLLKREPIRQVAEVKLLEPGRNLSTLQKHETEYKNSISRSLEEATFKLSELPPSIPDNSKKWETISKNPFDIIVRGLLKYKLPFAKSLKAVVVKKTSYVDPNDSQS